MHALAEKYRPQSWNEVVGQDRIVGIIRRFVEQGSIGGRAYWLSGKSGQGKTTIARLLASELADPMNVVELDATALTPSTLRDIERDAAMFGMGAKTGRVFIVNEAHGLRRDTIRQLLVLLERIPGHVAWVFTTTKAGEELLFEDSEDAHPLISRTLELPLAERGLADVFAERALAIAEAEGMGGKAIAQAKRLVNDCRANFRQVLSRIESGALLS